MSRYLIMAALADQRRAAIAAAIALAAHLDDLAAIAAADSLWWADESNAPAYAAMVSAFWTYQACVRELTLAEYDAGGPSGAPERARELLQLHREFLHRRANTITSGFAAINFRYNMRIFYPDKKFYLFP